MKRTVIVLLVLFVCAVVSRIGREEVPATSPFSIGGVELGMTRAELVARLGEPDSDEKGLLIFWRDRDVYVLLDSENRVVGANGSCLELQGMDCSPAQPHDQLPEHLLTFLGVPDWSSRVGDFVDHYRYDRYHLQAQFGCTGWHFYLGKRHGY